MAVFGKTSITISGTIVPRRRFTGWAWLYFLGYFVLPFLSLCFLIDLLLYSAAADLFGTCYAILCWFE